MAMNLRNAFKLLPGASKFWSALVMTPLYILIVFGITLGVSICLLHYIDYGTWRIVIIEKLVRYSCHLYISQYSWQHLYEPAFSMFIWLISHSPLHNHMSPTGMNGIESMSVNWCRQQRQKGNNNLDYATRDLKGKSLSYLSLHGLWRRSGPGQWKKCLAYLLHILNLPPVANTLRQSIWGECDSRFLLAVILSKVPRPCFYFPMLCRNAYA